jgi:hypothetical protein
MIPANTFTVAPEVADFKPPYDNAYTPLHHVAPGGVAVSDPSLGREYQNWEVTYTGGNIIVNPVGGATAFTLAVANVQSVSLAFDNNMGLAIAWKLTSGDAQLYYYDTLTFTYATRSFPDVTSCRICVDDSRDVYTTNSDVIFAYTKAGVLYYRQQRDRYDVEYTIGSTTKFLRRFGPSLVNRLQFELVGFD